MNAGIPSSDVDVVLAEEQVRVDVERVPVERVVIGKRIVTETRTLTVQVRREELFVERSPATDTAGSAVASFDELALVLHEEVPEVVVRTVPVERVRVYISSATGQVDVTEPLRREEALVEADLQ